MTIAIYRIYKELQSFSTYDGSIDTSNTCRRHNKFYQRTFRAWNPIHILFDYDKFDASF